MSVFITTVEKSCEKTMRGLLLLKKSHEGTQWGGYLCWIKLKKENSEAVCY